MSIPQQQAGREGMGAAYAPSCAPEVARLSPLRSLWSEFPHLTTELPGRAASSRVEWGVEDTRRHQVPRTGS